MGSADKRVDERKSCFTRHHTASGANAGGGNKTDRNPNLVHTLDTLDVEIPAATLPMDFDLYEIPGSVYRRAKEDHPEQRKSVQRMVRSTSCNPGYSGLFPSTLRYSEAHTPEFYHYPGRLQGYINAYLTETDHENPSKETLTAARHTRKRYPGRN